MASSVVDARSRDGRSTRLAADFLADAAEPVRALFAGAQTLSEFLGRPGRLTLEDRRLLVEQAIVLFEQNYVHLPLKVAMHGINPLQRLRLLAVRLERQTEQTMDPEPAFSAMLSEIFHSVRDLHTNYLLPAPYAGKLAFLPFRIEECHDDGGASRYVVTAVADGFSADGFAPGVTVTHWAGVPIERAVEMNAARFAGSNAAARHSRGVESLTIRPLLLHLPPDEEWVVVTYRTDDETVRELRQEWLVVDNLPPMVGPDEGISTSAASLGLDVETDAANRAKTLLFAPHVVAELDAGAAPIGTVAAAAVGAGPGDDLPTRMPGVFRARAVRTASGTFGHLRIFTFSVGDPEGFVDEFVRLTGLLPQNGLIVDVRDNGGGHIHASEFTLQTLTPRPITPAPVQFLSSPVNLRMCRRHSAPDDPIDLAPWVPSLDQAREIGATFSGATAMTPLDGANRRGQQYCGPVVLIVNARCYSATDIFAAGFADHRIGPVLGTDANTGAGGANVWQHQLLLALMEGADSPYRALPKGAGMRVAIRRTLRVGDQSGTPLEDLGVQPDHLHRMTVRDVLEGNTDLLDRAGALLAAMPQRALAATAVRRGTGLRVTVEATGVEWVALLADGRPLASAPVVDGQATLDVDDVPASSVLRAEGHTDGLLVAARIVPVAGARQARDGTRRRGRRTGAAARAAADGDVTLVYLHGAGNKPPAADVKRSWDRDLFGRDLDDRSRIAYYADLLHPAPAAILEDTCDMATALAAADVRDGAGPELLGDARDLMSELTPEGRELALSLTLSIAARAAAGPSPAADPFTAVLPLPRDIRIALLRQLLRRLIPDADAYLFTDRKEPIRDRFRAELDATDAPVVVVGHSLGTIVAYDVLCEPRYAGRDVRALFTLGSPLGYTEIQDVVTTPLRVPAPVQQWVNVADPLDVVTLDTGLANDFDGGGRIVDVLVDNPSPNNHAVCGYLTTRAVRSRIAALVPVTV
jgi:Peptidase family S41/PGAP1-like protein